MNLRLAVSFIVQDVITEVTSNTYFGRVGLTNELAPRLSFGVQVAITEWRQAVTAGPWKTCRPQTAPQRRLCCQACWSRRATRSTCWRPRTRTRPMMLWCRPPATCRRPGGRRARIPTWRPCCCIRAAIAARTRACGTCRRCPASWSPSAAPTTPTPSPKRCVRRTC